MVDEEIYDLPTDEEIDAELEPFFAEIDADYAAFVGPIAAALKAKGADSKSAKNLGTVADTIGGSLVTDKKNEINPDAPTDGADDEPTTDVLELTEKGAWESAWEDRSNGKVKNAQPQTKIWDESQHPRADSGQFGSGFGSSGSTPTSSNGSGGRENYETNRSDSGTSGILAKAKQAQTHAGKILAAGIKVPFKIASVANKVQKALLGQIEKRYGKKVKKAVATAILLGLPIPAPGASMALAGPIIAFAELHRQLFGGSKSADKDVSEEKLRELVKHCLTKMFDGKIPSEVDPEAAWSEEKVWESITKRYPTLKRHNASDTVQKAEFDDALMYAKSVISTDQLDRDNEIMVPRGCDLQDYREYAPWFLDHQGQSADGPPTFPFPIGSAKKHPLDRDCPPDIWIEEKQVIGGCYFNQETREAEICYALWKIGHMGATSIGFEAEPDWVQVLRGDEAENQFGKSHVRIHHKWRLCEVSIVGLGSNRQALREHAAKGKIEGKQIPDSMIRWFKQFHSPTKIFRAQPLAFGEWPLVS